MDVQDSSTDDQMDAAFDAAISDEWREGEDPDCLKVRRLIRIQEQAEDAVSRENALLANIGAVNTTLLTIAEHIGGAIKDAFESENVTVDQVAKMGPTLTQYLHVARQITCFTAIEGAISKAEQDANAMRSKQQRLALHKRSIDVDSRRAR